MPRRASPRGEWGKAPVYAKSHGDSSSDNETVSAGEQAAGVLQSHFDRGGDDIRPTGGIPMETRSRRRRSANIVSASSESRTISTRTSSWRMPVMKRGGGGLKWSYDGRGSHI